MLIKGLSAGSESSESSEIFMVSLSEWLSRDAQLRGMHSSRWTSPDLFGDYGLLIAYIIQHLEHISRDPLPNLPNTESAKSTIPPYHKRGSTLSFRRLAKTSRGLFGIVPASTRIGDGVTYFNGCLVPIIMREVAPVDNEGLNSRVRIRFRSAQQYEENNERSHVNGPRPTGVRQEQYMAKGSITASAVKHVVIVGMSFFDGIGIWNGREDQKWSDIYAIH
jgi:hypothetical protein